MEEDRAGYRGGLQEVRQILAAFTEGYSHTSDPATIFLLSQFQHVGQLSTFFSCNKIYQLSSSPEVLGGKKKFVT